MGTNAQLTFVGKMTGVKNWIWPWINWIWDLILGWGWSLMSNPGAALAEVAMPEWRRWEDEYLAHAPPRDEFAVPGVGAC